MGAHLSKTHCFVYTLVNIAAARESRRETLSIDTRGGGPRRRVKAERAGFGLGGGDSAKRGERDRRQHDDDVIQCTGTNNVTAINCATGQTRHFPSRFQADSLDSGPV